MLLDNVTCTKYVNIILLWINMMKECDIISDVAPKDMSNNSYFLNYSKQKDVAPKNSEPLLPQSVLAMVMPGEIFFLKKKTL